MTAPTLTFHGAAGMVTGSCFLLSVGGARILVDCGLFQGPGTGARAELARPAVRSAHDRRAAADARAHRPRRADPALTRAGSRAR